MTEPQVDTTATDPTDPTPPEPSATDPTDWKAEAEKFKGLHKKQEERAKLNAAAAKELEDLKRQNMSDVDAAIAKARDETTAQVTAQFGTRLAGEAIRAAAVGRVADVDALIEGVDAGKFLDAEGNPDRDAITAWMDRIAPVVVEQTPGTPLLPPGFYDLAQGTRTPTATVADPLEQALTDLSHR